MGKPLDDACLATLFHDARTVNYFTDDPVSDDLLRQLWDLLKLPPTSANNSPARFVFAKSAEAKERLRPALDGGNLEKTMSAPVTAIIAWDTRYYEHMAKLFPHEPTARSWFEGPKSEINGFRNGTLQGAYLIIAARALGLDCGPMSGFDNDAVDAAFFPDGRFKSNFLCNLGYGTDKNVFARSPRFSFDEVCEIQ
ncbi:MAG: malonic semialdehyde reductase [Pseudomonadota bacterium]